MTKVLEIDCITNTVIEREQTTAEKTQAVKDKTEAEAQTQAVKAKTAARQAVLDKLGLTSDEAAALFG